MPVLRKSHIAKARSLFSSALSPNRLEQIARQSEFIRRQRLVTGSGAFWAFAVSLGAFGCRYVSDVLRTHNAREDASLRYKPFWNRLAQAAFPRFMQTVFSTLCRELTTQVLRRRCGSSSSYFSDILIDDGSSFAVAEGLKTVFPGRFTDKTPAAVELHAHMSLLTDNLVSVAVAPDIETERQFLVAPEELPRRSLSLRDRGYVDLKYFAALQKREAFLICRATSQLNPIVADVIKGSKRWIGKKLNQLPRTKLAGADLVVRWQRHGLRELRLRLVVRHAKTQQTPKKKRARRRSWNKKNSTLLLLTNLPSSDFDGDAALQLYRLRWQVELVFKDWKSFASLHAFQTTNRYIAEGLIWASLCAAFIKRALAHFAQKVSGYEISTRIAAAAGPHILPMLADWARHPRTSHELIAVFAFLANNARSTHPERRPKLPKTKLGFRPLDVRGLKD